jgi:hypothetical protein
VISAFQTVHSPALFLPTIQIFAKNEKNTEKTYTCVCIYFIIRRTNKTIILISVQFIIVTIDFNVSAMFLIRLPRKDWKRITLGI